MRRRSVIMLAAAALAGPALAAQSQWRTLFDGKSLAGWTPIGAANWTLVDGAVQADNGMGGHLVSNETFGDFEVRAEFWVSEDANSGVFIRATNPAQVSPSNAYEVNIYDRRPDQTYATGAIVDVSKLVQPAPKAGGRWNLMEISAKGDRLTVALNGQKTVDNVQNGKHTAGRITMQYGGGVVKFRKIEVRSI